jgi:transposase InsO family protein
LHNHAQEIWACDFMQVTDWRFRGLFVFVMIELGSRRVLHVGVTRHPTDAWVAQQLREATPFGIQPRFLVRDNDSKYGRHVRAVTQDAGIKVLKTPIAAPRANAICERFIGSVRRECLNHHLILSEAHLRRIMKEYVVYFNTDRPHQGIDQHLPDPSPSTTPSGSQTIIGQPSWVDCITHIEDLRLDIHAQISQSVNTGDT